MNVYGLPVVSSYKSSSPCIGNVSECCSCGCCVDDPQLIEPAYCACKPTKCNTCRLRKSRRLNALKQANITIPEKRSVIPPIVATGTVPQTNAVTTSNNTLEFVVDEHTTQAEEMHKSVFNTSSYIWQTKSSSLEQDEIQPKRKRGRKRKQPEAEEQDMSDYDFQYEIPQEGVPCPEPQTQSAKIQDNKTQFFALCDKHFQEVCEGMFILPHYTVHSGKGKLLPVVTTYFNFEWSCSCPFKVQLGKYAGKFCWHEEWAVKKVVCTLQDLITETEQKMAQRQNRDEEQVQEEEMREVEEVRIEEVGEEEVVSEIIEEVREEGVVYQAMLESEPARSNEAPRQRSSNYFRDREVEVLSQTEGRSTRSAQPSKLPPTRVSLAIARGLPEVYVDISSEWVIEKVHDKRFDEQSRKYQYLVGYQGWPRSCNRWLSATAIPEKEMIREFELQRAKAVHGKRHIAAWYPFGEQFAVKWNDLPFFIIPYGSEQVNKFCVVSVNKQGSDLKCKHAHNPGQPQHQVHVQLVKAKMKELGYVLRNGTIDVASNTQGDPAVVVEVLRVPEVSKPVSQQKIDLIGEKELWEARLGHFKDSSSIPAIFKPTSHPPFCKCETVVVEDGVEVHTHTTKYKSTSEPLSFNATLWLPIGAPVERQIHVWKCCNNASACNVYYDGHSDGIFNYSNKTLMSHVVLFECLFSFMTGKGETFDGFINSRHYVNSFACGYKGTKAKAFLQKATFIKVFIAFLQNISKECKPMHCALCGVYPKWMGFDGVSLAMNKEFVAWDTVETIHPKDGSCIALGDEVLPQKERMLIQNLHTRQMLAQFVSSKPHPLSIVEYNTMMAALHNECPSLYTVIHSLYLMEYERSDGEIYNYSFPGVWDKFLALLSASTSTVWIIRPTVVPLILHLLQTRTYNQDYDVQLSSYCPPLTKVLRSIPSGKLSDDIVALLQDIIAVIKTTYPNKEFSAAAPSPTTFIPSVVEAASSTAIVPDEGTTWTHGLHTLMTNIQKQHIPLSSGFDYTVLDKYAILPELDPKLSATYWSFPKIRKLPRYAGIDVPPKTGVLQEWVDVENDASQAGLVCIKEEKRSYATQKHTAGLFVGSCLHTIGYGFHAMVAPEGRKDLLKVLFERIPQEVLDEMHVLYDFNCQEAEYMLNRVPDMFANIRLFIDRWHGASHKCASTFKLQAFPVFQELISTGAESLNSFLQRLHGQAPFMKQETFVIMVQSLMGIRNFLLNLEMMRLLDLYKAKE